MKAGCGDGTQLRRDVAQPFAAPAILQNAPGLLYLLLSALVVLQCLTHSPTGILLGQS